VRQELDGLSEIQTENIGQCNRFCGNPRYLHMRNNNVETLLQSSHYHRIIDNFVIKVENPSNEAYYKSTNWVIATPNYEKSSQ